MIDWQLGVEVLDTCIAVTRGGWGDVWLIPVGVDPDTHPLIQYGDAVIREEGDVLKLYWGDESNLSRLVHDERLAERLAEARKSGREAVRRMCGDVYRRLAKVAKPIPREPRVICDLVKRDRELYSKERQMTDTTTTENGLPAERVARNRKFKDADTITVIAEKNPKKEGTKAHTKFALYHDGITVKEFVDAGGALGDVDYDVKKGFIKVDAAA